MIGMPFQKLLVCLVLMRVSTVEHEVAIDM